MVRAFAAIAMLSVPRRYPAPRIAPGQAPKGEPGRISPAASARPVQKKKATMLLSLPFSCTGNANTLRSPA